MPFIVNNKFKEIMAAGKNGNTKAQEIIQGMRKGISQADIDRLVEEYYNVGVPNDEKPIEAMVPEEALVENGVENFEETQNIADEGVFEEVAAQSPDYISALTDDMDGLLDENEIDDTTFGDFLKNKSRDTLRARKNADYFKAYSPEDRESYMNTQIENYKGKFNTRLKDIERRHRDMDGAISTYAQRANTALDDDIGLDVNTTSEAYDSIVNDENIMHGFGRGWDEQDTTEVMNALSQLMVKYGKQNVIAALNILRSDNNNYRDYLNNQVDEEIGRYSKSISSLLK